MNVILYTTVKNLQLFLQFPQWQETVQEPPLFLQRHRQEEGFLFLLIELDSWLVPALISHCVVPTHKALRNISGLMLVRAFLYVVVSVLCSDVFSSVHT